MRQVRARAKEEEISSLISSRNWHTHITERALAVHKLSNYPQVQAAQICTLSGLDPTVFYELLPRFWCKASASH